MPIKVSPVAGCLFYIGSAPVDLPDTDVTEASFSAVTWVPVGNYQTMGNSGDGAENIATNLINRRRTINLKGTRQAPTRSDNFALNLTDVGQLAMIAAEQTDYNFPFRIDLNDALVPKSSAATITIAAPGVVSWTAHGLLGRHPGEVQHHWCASYRPHRWHDLLRVCHRFDRQLLLRFGHVGRYRHHHVWHSVRYAYRDHSADPVEAHVHGHGDLCRGRQR